MIHPINVKVPFNFLGIGSHFYFEDEHFKKITSDTAWSIKNWMLWKEWAFGLDTPCKVAQGEEIVPLLFFEEAKQMSKQIYQIADGKILDGNDWTNVKNWSKTFADDPIFTDIPLQHFSEIATIHLYYKDHAGEIFQPSYIEVLSQIPKDVRKAICGFEVIQDHEIDPALLMKPERGGYHSAYVKLFVK